MLAIDLSIEVLLDEEGLQFSFTEYILGPYRLLFIELADRLFAASCVDRLGDREFSIVTTSCSFHDQQFASDNPIEQLLFTRVIQHFNVHIARLT